MFFIKAWVVFTATAAITTTAATKRRPMLKSDSCQDFPFRPAALASDAIDWAVTLREQSWRQMLESRKPLLSKYVFFLICLGFSGLRWFPCTQTMWVLPMFGGAIQFLQWTVLDDCPVVDKLHQFITLLLKGKQGYVSPDDASQRIIAVSRKLRKCQWVWGCRESWWLHLKYYGV